MVISCNFHVKFYPITRLPLHQFRSVWPSATFFGIIRPWTIPMPLLLRTPLPLVPCLNLYFQLEESIAFYRSWMWPKRMARMEFHLVFCANAHPSCRPFSLDCSVSFSKLKISQNPGSIRWYSPFLRAEIAPIHQITARFQSPAPFRKFLRPF